MGKPRFGWKEIPLAEEFRDTMLAASGELNPEIGGIYYVSFGYNVF